MPVLMISFKVYITTREYYVYNLKIINFENEYSYYLYIYVNKNCEKQVHNCYGSIAKITVIVAIKKLQTEIGYGKVLFILVSINVILSKSKTTFRRNKFCIHKLNSYIKLNKLISYTLLCYNSTISHIISESPNK